MKEKIIAILIKNGNNEDSSIDLVNSNYNIAVQMFPTAKASKLAEVISCI